MSDFSIDTAEVVTDAASSWNRNRSSFFISWLWSGVDRELLDRSLLLFIIDQSVEFASLSSNDFIGNVDAVSQKIQFSAVFENIVFESTQNDELDQEILKGIVLQQLLLAAQAKQAKSPTTRIGWKYK